MGENICNDYISGTAKVRLSGQPCKNSGIKRRITANTTFLVSDPLWFPRTRSCGSNDFQLVSQGPFMEQLWDGFHAPEYYINFFSLQWMKELS